MLTWETNQLYTPTHLKYRYRNSALIDTVKHVNVATSIKQ